MNLVIVESPTKAKTISKFLGKEYKVESSYGHVRDLPKSKLGVDVEHDFEPQYLIPKKAKPVVAGLKKDAAMAKEVILATDEDREGEAIAWHLANVLDLKNSKRIVFHEITPKAIQDALKNPRDLDLRLVDAQQARRILDRLVGYKLSPFLWKKLHGGLSAGRVQSVAVRLIVERENEIRNFKPQEYWTIAALLSKNGVSIDPVRSREGPQRASASNGIEANLYSISGKVLEKFDIKTGDEAKKIVSDADKAPALVTAVEAKEIRKNPFAPFITSTLQQEAAKRLGFSSKKTMFLAQRLYENGRITYMRTDSVNLSQESLAVAKQWLAENFGGKYAHDAPRVFKKQSRLAQEAHEAIRPTSPALTVEKLEAEKDEKRLYELIWRRFVASQMPQAVFNATRIEFEVRGKTGAEYIFAANGLTLLFDGFLKVWPTKFAEKELPVVEKNEQYKIKELKSEQHFTDPPPRYNEASLIKILEKYGIGRPSTYAPIISVIQKRNYVEKIQGRFHPTETGERVNQILAEHFPKIIDIDFTAKMEEELDEIADGSEQWRKVMREFYLPFSKNLEEKYETVQKEKFDEATDEICEKCGKPMVVKRSRFGKFLACSGYPECKNTKKLKSELKQIGMKCPKCGEGEIVERRVNKGRARGKMFWGCSRYPDCDYATWSNPLTAS